MDPSPVPIFKFHLDDTLGISYIGNLAAAICYGITTIQTYTYYRRSGDDALFLKLVVFVLWILGSLQIAFISHAFYTCAITNFMNPPALMRTVWSVMAHVVVSGVSDILVRGFFCLRVWKLSGKNWVLAGLIVSTSLVAFAGNLAFTIRGLMIGNFLKFTEISWIVYMNLACCISADMLIAISLCTSLMRRRTGFTKTDSLLRTLMVYTINTGALTGICTILCLIFYATMPPNNFTYVAFYFVLPPLLVNAFLATLNARQALRENTMGGVISIQASPRGAVEISTRSEVIRTYSTSDTFGMRPTSMGDSSQGELNEWKSKFSRLRDSVVEEV